jgi:hypothetical protein
MNIFSKKTDIQAAEAKVEKAQTHRDELFTKCHGAKRRLIEAREAVKAAEAANVERVLRGEPILETFEATSELWLAQDIEKAATAAFEHAEGVLKSAIDELVAAQSVDRSARYNASMRRLSDLIEGVVLKEGDVLKAIVNEDPKNLTAEGWQVPETYLQEWTARAERLMAPPPTPKPDPNMRAVKIIRAQVSPGSKFTHYYTVGETVSVRHAEAEHLIRVGIAEPYTAPPEEEPGEAA